MSYGDRGLEWQAVRLGAWPGARTPPEERRPHPFRRTLSGGSIQRTVPGIDWSGTCDLLAAELYHLGAIPGTVLLQLDVEDRHIRKDGWIRADASPASPGVVLSFESEVHGHLSYPADTFTDWRANVRAIAVALENLRRVARYGVGRHGEQYRGWKALPAEISGGPHAVIARHAGCTEEDVRRNPAKRIRAARLATHPDRGAPRALWDEVEAAALALGHR